jgi:hypothetical protein
MKKTMLALAVASLSLVASVANSGPPVPSVNVLNIPLPVTSAEKAVPYTALRSSGGGGYCEVIGDGQRTTTATCEYSVPFTEARLIRSVVFRPIEPTVQVQDGGASCVAVLWVHPTGDPDVSVVIGTANWTSGDYRSIPEPLKQCQWPFLRMKRCICAYACQSFRIRRVAARRSGGGPGIPPRSPAIHRTAPRSVLIASRMKRCIWRTRTPAGVRTGTSMMMTTE